MTSRHDTWQCYRYYFARRLQCLFMKPANQNVVDLLFACLLHKILVKLSLPICWPFFPFILSLPVYRDMSLSPKETSVFSKQHQEKGYIPFQIAIQPSKDGCWQATDEFRHSFDISQRGWGFPLSDMAIVLGKWLPAEQVRKHFKGQFNSIKKSWISWHPRGKAANKVSEMGWDNIWVSQ